MTAMTAHGLADADLLRALGGLGGRQVDKVDGSQQQQKSCDGQQIIESRLVGLAALVEEAVVRIEVEIGERLKTADFRKMKMAIRVRFSVRIRNDFGELCFDGRWFYAGQQP